MKSKITKFLFLATLAATASLPSAYAGSQCDWVTDPSTGRPQWRCDVPESGTCEWQTDDSGNPVYVCR